MIPVLVVVEFIHSMDMRVLVKTNANTDVL